MRVLLVEDLTSGALARELPEWRALAPEGAAMIRAVAEDARHVADWRVEVIWSTQLGPFPIKGVTAHLADSPDEEARLFGELSRLADRTFVIAPEFDGRLETRRRMVAAAGGEFAGSSAVALALCADKLQLAAHWQSRGIPTMPTWPFDPARAADIVGGGRSNGLVIKPRDGAGSMNTFHVRRIEELRLARACFDGEPSRAIMQPFVPGQAISVGAIVSGGEIEIFPPATQHIEYGQRLRYLGGAIGTVPDDRAIGSLVRRALAPAAGLRGVVGVDLILPDDGGGPVAVEINPRLTTSYLGYRQVATRNLAPRLIDPDAAHGPIAWRDRRVEFTATS